MADSNQHSVQLEDKIAATCSDGSDSQCKNTDVISSYQQQPLPDDKTEVFDQDRAVVRKARAEENSPHLDPSHEGVAAIATATKFHFSGKDSYSDGVDDVIAPSQNDLQRTQHGESQQMHQVHGVVDASVTPESIVFYVTILFIAMISVYSIWKQRNQRRRRKKWLESSDEVLNALRSNQSRRDIPRDETKDDVATPLERSNGISNESTCRTISDSPNGIDIVSKQSFGNSTATTKTVTTPPQKKNIKTKNQHALPPISSHIRQIRALQQQKYATNIQSRRRKLNERQRILHDSLQHSIAEEAYQRRLTVMAEERQFLLTATATTTTTTITSTPQHDNQTVTQPPLNQDVEMERAALLRQQNLDYQESLARDQQRAKEFARRNGRKLKRRILLQGAKNRLLSEGVDTFGLLEESRQVIDSNGGVEANSKSSTGRMVRIRLHLPSGKRVQGIFDSFNVVGLVYDLALVALDKEELLSNEEHENDVDSIAENEGEENPNDFAKAIPMDNTCDYCHVQSEWKELFPQFSILHTMPRRKLDDLVITLKECGLTSSVMLMVAVESD